MKPRLLDLFCGAGGAAMGYHRAGFEVVGVDHVVQPHYPFEFHQADAMTYPLEGFDAIHASPPCQAYSRMRFLPWLRDKKYPRLIEPMLERFKTVKVPWILENVMDSRHTVPCMRKAPWLCGTIFDMPFYRHRLFANNWRLVPPVHRRHRHVIEAGRMLGGRARKGHEAMRLDWMTREERDQAIPPAYTEYIGQRLMEYLR